MRWLALALAVLAVLTALVLLHPRGYACLPGHHCGDLVVP